MKLRNLLAVFCLLIIASSASAQKLSKTGNVEELKDGAARTAVLKLNEDFGIPMKSFSFRVPKNAYAVRITISGAEADLDLFLNHGAKIEDLSAASHSSEEEHYNETIFITRQSDTPLETGIYYLAAAYQYDYLPVIDGKSSDEIDFSIKLDVIQAEPETVLRPGSSYELELKPENGMFSVVAVDIPPRDVRIQD